MAYEKFNENDLIRIHNNIGFLRENLSNELSRRGMKINFSEGFEINKPIRAVHVQELRDNIDKVKKSSYIDNPLIPNINWVKPKHLDQIYAVLKTLESVNVHDKTSSCDAGCVGLCASCVGTCSGDCLSGCTNLNQLASPDEKSIVIFEATGITAREDADCLGAVLKWQAPFRVNEAGTYIIHADGLVRNYNGSLYKDTITSQYYIRIDGKNVLYGDGGYVNITGNLHLDSGVHTISLCLDALGPDKRQGGVIAQNFHLRVMKSE